MGSGMKTVAVVMGTRPEVIKLARVVHHLRARADVNCRVVGTAQHRELLDQALADFELGLDADLDLMRPDQTLAGLTARAVGALDAEFGASGPDMVVVQGDTTSAFCAALAGFYRRIPVVHVEAGLRTWDLGAPWPEEANRSLIGRLARWHFAPTERAAENLRREGIEAGRVEVTGNTAIDALMWMRERVRETWAGSQWRGSGGDGRVVLATVHRRESFGEPLRRVCAAIAALAGRFPLVSFVLPVHPNPEVSGVLEDLLGPRVGLSNVRLVAPLGYRDMVELMDACTLILTDSGGIQEEAPSLGKPVLVLRDETERWEGIEGGYAVLVGTSRDGIVAEATRILEAGWVPRGGENPFGDGRAAERIVARCVGLLTAEGGSGA